MKIVVERNVGMEIRTNGASNAPAGLCLSRNETTSNVMSERATSIWKMLIETNAESKRKTNSVFRCISFFAVDAVFIEVGPLHSHKATGGKGANASCYSHRNALRLIVYYVT